MVVLREEGAAGVRSMLAPERVPLLARDELALVAAVPIVQT